MRKPVWIIVLVLLVLLLALPLGMGMALGMCPAHAPQCGTAMTFMCFAVVGTLVLALAALTMSTRPRVAFVPRLLIAGRLERPPRLR